jgi:hypothetical protein
MAEVEVGVGPWVGDWPDDPRLDPELLATETAATSSTGTATGGTRPSSPTSTAPGGTPSTSPSRTGSTTSTSARSCAPPTPSTPRPSTSSAGDGGTGGARWSPTATSTRSTTTRTTARPRRLGGGEGHTADRDRQRARAVPLETHRCPGLRARLRAGGAGPDRRRMLAACDVVLQITQFGSTRSINAGAAAAIAMHAWVRQHAPARPGRRPTATSPCARRDRPAAGRQFDHAPCGGATSPGGGSPRPPARCPRTCVAEAARALGRPRASEWKRRTVGAAGSRCYRADLLRLAQDYERAVAHLPALPAAGT